MVERLERINKLQSFGLTENQAKAYLALLDLGQASASALNKLSGVPRNKVYSVVEELNEKGLVDVVLEDPIVFAPRPITGFLDLLVAKLEDRRSELEEQKDALAEEFKVRPDVGEDHLQVGSFRLFRGRRAVLHQHRRMSRDSQSRVRVLYSIHSAARMLDSGSLRDHRKTEGSKQVDLEIYTPLSEENVSAVDRIYQTIGDAMRVSRDMPENLVIKMVDDREVMFTHFVPDSPSLTSGDDIGIWTDNPVFLAVARALFQMAATGSRSVPAARAMLKNDIVPPHFEVVQDEDRLNEIMLQSLYMSRESALVVPAQDVRAAMERFTPEERKRMQAAKRRSRIISDMPPDELASQPWGPKTELRHLSPLPACFAILDAQVLRAYDMDDVDFSLFGGPGTAVVVTDLKGATAEAKDHFERLWSDAEPVPRPVTATAGAADGGRTKLGR